MINLRLVMFDTGVEILFIFSNNNYIHVGMSSSDEGRIDIARTHISEQA